MISPELVLSVQGQILSCYADNATDLFCKFEFQQGADWSIISGCEEGVSQCAKTDINHTCVWNYPINAVFKAPRPYGWPQIIISVYGVNMFGNQTVVGYGAFHLPTCAGHTEFNIALFSRAPTSSERFVSWFSGRMPEAIPLSFIASGESREIIKTESHGYVRVVFDCIISGLNKLDLTVA